MPLLLERHDSPHRGPEVWIATHLQWRDDVIIYGIDIEHIVNNAILDLLTKE